jgi:hypothetical protein
VNGPPYDAIIDAGDSDDPITSTVDGGSSL